MGCGGRRVDAISNVTVRDHIKNPWLLAKNINLDNILNIDINFLMSFLIEFYKFMMARKKFWLIPILLFLLIFGGFVVVTQGTAVAPFIYTIF